MLLFFLKPYWEGVCGSRGDGQSCLYNGGVKRVNGVKESYGSVICWVGWGSLSLIYSDDPSLLPFMWDFTLR